MSTNIDSLDIQIKTTAGSSAANIEELASALAKLAGSSNLTKVTNSLTKLSTSLSTLQSSSGTISSLSTLAGAMESLANVQKPTGFASAIKQLKKLGEVTAGLDDGVIDEFTAKMEKLANALEPLAARINQVAAGFDKLPANLRKAVTATNKLDSAISKTAKSTRGHSGALDTQNVNLAAVISNLGTYYHSIQGIANAYRPMVEQALEWDGIQYRFGRAFGEDAEEVYAHAQRINEVLYINMQQFMQYSSLYGSLLKGFGLEQEKVTTISVGLTELSYDIWAAYNDRYKTLEDASEAIRSAITGEIEPIRNAGIALTEASMQEFADNYDRAAVAAKDVNTAFGEIQDKAKDATEEAANLKDMIANGIGDSALQATADTLGLGVSVANLTEAQKAELRYATMVNAAMNQGIVGTYAKEMNTAEGAVRTLSQQFKSLSQALGSLFLPILTTVVPWVSAFVQVLYELVAAIAAFFNIPFFKVDWGNSSGGIGSVTDAAKDAETALGGAGAAAKKLKDYTMGFDELNVIDPDVGSGGGGGGSGAGAGADWGAGLDLDTLWGESVFADVSDKVDKIKAKIEPFVNFIKENFDHIKDVVLAIGTGLLAWKIADGVTGFIDSIKTGKIDKMALGITIAVTGFTLEFSGAYDLGKDGATLANVLKTAIGAALGVAGSLLIFGTGPVGWIVGIGLSLIVGITGFAIGNAERLKEEDLAERFGDIVLDEDQIKDLVNEALDFEWEEGVNLHIGLIADLEGFKTRLKSDVEVMNRIGWKIDMGLTLTEADKANYQAAVMSFAANTTQYLQDRGYAISVGVKATLGEGELAESIIASSDAVTEMVSSHVASLGEQLGELLTDGIAIDEQEAVERLTNEIKTITEIISQSEFEAKIDVINLKYGGADMTPESWEQYYEEINRVGEEMKEHAEESVTATLSSLRANVSIAEYYLSQDPNNPEYIKMWNDAKDALQEYVDSDPLEATVKEVDFTIYDNVHKTLTETFKQEVNKAKPILEKDLKELYTAANKYLNGEEMWEDEFENIVTWIREGLTSELNNLDISTSARKNIAEQLKKAIPEEKDLTEALNAAVKAGKAVPEGVKEGLTDIYTWKSMSADADERLDGINFLVGQKLSNDPSFFEMLEKADEYGWLLDDAIAMGINSNTQFIKDAATNTVGVFQDGVEVARLDITPDLVKNMESLGVDLSTGVMSGASQGMQAQKKSWLDWAIWPWNWFKEKNEIDSPSKLFKRGGGWLVQGLLNGISEKFGDLRTWFTTNVSPKLTLEYWKGKFANISKGLGEKLDEAWEKVKSFFDYEEWKKKINNAVSALKEHFKIPSLPKIKLEWSIDYNVTGMKKKIVDALGLTGWPSLKWGTYAQGGFPSMGEMFIAREAGPELVGRIGNRTTVANNDQIIEGVSAGVYKAVVAAMGAVGGRDNQPIVVYLDGKQIYTSVKKTESERGINIMGNQLGYAY